MVLQAHPTIEVHQCLFGYKDGHRLLASSLNVSEKFNSLLLVLSDLAPGLTFSDTEGYWTGVPLPAAKYYALMRTWTAPEMPRPGCVWTHVLFVSFADIPRFPDLSILAQQARRPEPKEQFESYSRPLQLEARSLASTAELRPVEVSVALCVIRSLYAPSSHSLLSGPPGAFDEAIFAVWSQQWPRLRRAFAFRTAVSASDTTNLGIRFNICVTLAPNQADLKKSLDISLAETWEKIAVEDLRRRDPTEFRRFLWRYGSDIRRGRDRFRFLAELYLATRTDLLANGQLSNIMVRVLQGLPFPDEGRLLKEDLVSWSRSPYSLLPPSDLLATLEFFISNPEARALPPPPEEALDSIDKFWPSRSDEILSLAELAAERQPEVGKNLLEHLARFVEPSAFLATTIDRPRLRAQLLSANPLLLDNEHLTQVPQPELSRLLALIPENGTTLAERVIQRLLATNDPQVAIQLTTQFPKVAMRLIAHRIEQSSSHGETQVGEAWVRALTSRKADFVRGGFIESARSTTSLAAFADILDYDSAEVLATGPLPWATGLRNSRDDIKGRARQVFLTFLLAVALKRPVRGCEAMLELAFEPTHTDLAHSSLPYEAFIIINRHIPDAGWWRQWDICLRLRLAVLNAYAAGGLDPQSFCRLTRNASTLQLLVDLAYDTKKGRNFLKKTGFLKKTKVNSKK